MGEPGGRHCPPPPAEHIGGEEATWGTETSKYPEEEKSTEIPLVVASERGPRANRRWRKRRRGCRTARLQNLVVAERPGKAGDTGLEPRTRNREDRRLAPEYCRTRETRWEAGGTTLQP